MTDKRLSNILKKTRRVVIKVGSSVLVDQDEEVSSRSLSKLALGMASLQNDGIEVVLVSSGAVASGMHFLGFEKKPRKMSEIQACAAIGQPILMQKYQKAFGVKKIQVAQVLLTRRDLQDRTQFLNAKHTLSELLRRRVIPIINENDTVVVDEIRVGDNDNLAALVACLVEADLLILITDQDGFYTADPRVHSGATRIPVIEKLDKTIFEKASDTRQATSVGGMKTKLEAAKKAARSGIPTIIANGRKSKVLEKIFAGQSVGTLFIL